MKEVVLITGVSSGIGNRLAHEYLDRGANVIGISRRSPEDLLQSDGFLHLSIDLSDERQISSELQQSLPEDWPIQTLILNAGILGQLADMKDTSLEDLKTLMNVNVWANKTVLDAVLQRYSTIKKVITISSGAAVNGNRGWSGYSISKVALNMLTMLYARENENVHFAAIAPGLVDTAMQDYLCGHKQDERFKSLEVLKSKRGTGEMPSPAEAAKKLILLFDSVEKYVESGGFVDIRHLPQFGQM